MEPTTQSDRNIAGVLAPFDIGAISPLKYFVAIATGLGLMFAFIAPNESTGLISRLLQWQLQTWIPLLLLIGSHVVIHRFNAIQALNPWVRLVISGTLGAALFSPFALLVDVGLGVQSISSENWLAAWLDELTGVAPPVVIAWLAINAPWVANWRMEKVPEPVPSPISEPDPDNPVALGQHAATATNDKPTSDQTLLSRLPVDSVDQIRAIKSELHYLSVNTTAGRSMVLYNLKDAMNELRGEHSIQPHRSYWVNRHHVDRLYRAGRKNQLILTDGSAVPVSRLRLPEVREMIEER